MRINRFGLVADVLLVSLMSLKWMSLAVSQSVPGVWIPLWVAMGGTVWISTRRMAGSNRIALLFVATVLLMGVWAVWFGVGAAVFGMVAWALFVVRRIRYVQDFADDDVQFGRLWWDMGYMAFAAAIMDSPSIMGFHRWLVIGFVLTVAIRIGGLRSAQIERARAKGVADMVPLLRSFGVVALIVGIGLFCFFAFPQFRSSVLLASIGAMLIYWLFSSRQNIIGAAILSAVLIVILWLVNDLEKNVHRKPKGESVTPAHLGLGKLREGAQHSHAFHVPSFVWIIIVLMAFGAIFLILKSLRVKPVKEEQMADAPVIERSRLTRVQASRFSGGHGIIGLTLRWLDVQHRTGRAIRRGETVRSYWIRMSNSNASDAESAEGTTSRHEASAASSTLEQVVDLYEAARYGGQRVPDDRVSALEQRLEQLGLFGRRRER